MPQRRSEVSPTRDEPNSKRRRIDTGELEHDISPRTLPLPPQHTVDPIFAHRWKLDGRATINNAADTRYFSRSKALVYHFLDVHNAVEDQIGQLESCTLQCGICGRGKWQ